MIRKIYTIAVKLIISVGIVAPLNGCSSEHNGYSKYDIESGLIEYELETFLSNEKITKTCYFSNFGATEFIESSKASGMSFFSILKQDSSEYLILSDSAAIKNSRGYDDIFEKCVLDKRSTLFLKDFFYKKLKDTMYMDRNCEIYSFRISSTETAGRAVAWKRIPLIIESETEGIPERIKVAKIDTSSEIPTSKRKLSSLIKFE